MKRHLMAVFALSGIATVSALLYAQDAGNQNNQDQQRNAQQQGDNQGNRRDRQGGGDWQARMAERMKSELGVSDEEWTVLQPKFEKVMTAQRQARMGGFGRGGFGGGPGGGQNNNDDTPVAKASQDLRTALENQSTSADDIKSKVTALREARKAAEADLKTAREDLRALLTQRQEASLVVMGILD